MPSQTALPKPKVRLPSTQRYIPIAEIRENTVVLKDGSMRAVLLVSSVNFALKSHEEQTATVQGYISFLNSLSFPVQIVIQSRRLIIDSYLEDLQRREREQTNDLLRIQMADYRQFVHELVSLGEIVSKRFFLIIPYNPVSDKNKGFLTRLSESLSPTRVVRLKEEKFRLYRSALDRNIAHIAGALQSMGLSAVELDTQALIELFYATYNPEIAMSEKAVDVDKLEIEQ